MRVRGMLILFFIFSLLREAYAYLDPGTGSYIFQLLLGALFGVLYTVKIFWKNIKGFLLNLLLRK